MDERSLLFLARGDLSPIAWDVPPNRPFGDRFVAVTLDDGQVLYGDRGETPTPERLLAPTPVDLEVDTCWWHPFQLWRAIRMVRSLSVPISDAQPLHGPESHQKMVAWFYEHHDPRLSLIEMTTQPQWEESYRVSCLLLAAEPLVVEGLTNRIRLSAFGETFDGLFEWRQRSRPQSAFDGYGH